MNLKPLLIRVGIWPGSDMWDLGRGIVLAGTVGAMAGVGAIAFHWLCQAVMHYSLEWVAGYRPPGPAGGGELFPALGGTFRPWLLIVVPAVGGLVSGGLVYWLAPEAEGHGTDAAIHAYHHKRGMIRWRVPFVKMLASAVTLGTGGSGGQEGPIAQIGAGCGSTLGTWLKLSNAERRSLMAAGVGAGIGAIFHAPLAGAIFATEVLYRDPDFEAENLIPAFMSTTVAYSVYSLVYGFEPLFEVGRLHFHDPYMLMPLTVLAVALVIASFAFVKCFYGVHALFKRWRVPMILKPFVGGAATGALAVGMYYSLGLLNGQAGEDSLSVLSVGYGYLQKLLSSSGGEGILLPVLLAVCVGKILATSVTIGSGGSAGVFAPSMVIGGTLGAVVGLGFDYWLPNLGIWGDIRLEVYVILGMAGFFAASANTPVSALIMVSEMTGSYALLLPAMWVCALTYLLGRGQSIFSEQVASRVQSPAHRGDFIVDVLSGLTVRDAVGRAISDFKTVPMGMPLSDIVQLITDTRQTCFPVVDEQGDYYGLFGISDVRRFLYDSGGVGDLAVAQDLASTEEPILTLQTDLSSAIGQFASGGYEELPVVDAEQPGKVLALMRRQDVIAAYSMRLLAMRKDGAEFDT